MDSLVELPLTKWPVLQEKLKKLWLLNFAGFYSIHLNLKCPFVREAFQFKVYCPFGDMDAGFVGINVKPGGSQDVILFSITEDTTKLEQALVQTKLIDWKKQVCIDLVSSLILRSLEKIRPVLKFRKFDVGHVKTLFLDKKTGPFEDLKYPPNTFITDIKEEDLPHVDDVWPYKFPGSVAYFSILASNHLSYGLYSNDKLIAWVFLNEYNFLCHLYCEEEYRRNGYAELVLKYVINEQLKQSNDAYAYVVAGNEKPARLFAKLGFVDVDQGACICFCPEVDNTTVIFVLKCLSVAVPYSVSGPFILCKF